MVPERDPPQASRAWIPDSWVELDSPLALAARLADPRFRVEFLGTNGCDLVAIVF